MRCDFGVFISLCIEGTYFSGYASVTQMELVTACHSRIRGSIMEQIEWIEMVLVQEAVVNWESMDGVEEIGTREVYIGNTEERAFLSRILFQDMEKPVYIEVRLLREVDDEQEDELEFRFENGVPVIWQ